MSNIFSGLSGVQWPDTVMNKGPLPGTGGLPKPLHDTPDGRINYNSSLLGDIEPYAYAEPGYISSQTSYLNIPHKIQKIVPFLFLPEPDGTGSFRLNHPIDDGDIVFTLRLDRNSEICTGLSNRSVQRHGLGTAIDPVINLCTLNYLLAGLQLCGTVPTLRDKWDRFMYYLDSVNYRGNAQQRYGFHDIKRLVRHLIRPFGVAHGSEKQGGQHEGSLSAVTWPVSFVISLTLDGKDANVVNIWHKYDVEAGNDLVLRLKPVPLPPSNKYTLNHWGKGLVEKVFTPNTMRAVQQQNDNVMPTHIWQLVPDVFSLDYEPPTRSEWTGLMTSFRPQGSVSEDFCWQEEGYWHIARAQVHSRKYGVEEFYYNDMANNLRTAHMDLTFQPTFFAVPYRDFHTQDGLEDHAMPLRNTCNALGSEFDEDGPPGGSAKRHSGGGDGSWQSSLRLEKGFASSSTAAAAASAVEEQQRPAGNRVSFDLGPGSKRARTVMQEGGFPMPRNNRGSPAPISGGAWNPSLSSAASARGSPAPILSWTRAPEPMAVDTPMTDLLSPASLPPLPAGEDIGTFDEAGPVMPLASAAAPAHQQPASHVFSVAKPGLPKPPRRPTASASASASASAGRNAARGGLVGSVLAADGSVTHEQSRIL